MATITTSDSQPVSGSGNSILSRAFVLNWEVIVYLVIFALAIFTRFYHLGDRVMSHDESLHTRYSYNLYANGDYQHTPLMHGPIMFHFVALSYTLFGDNDFTARIYPAVLGIMLVMFPILFRRWLGRWGAILASIMILISPLLMYYNRYIREDTPSIFYSLIMFYSAMMYLAGPDNRRGKGYWLYILAAAMLGSLGSKEVAFFYIFIFGSFLLLFWLARLAQRYRQVPAKSLFNILVVAILLGGVAALGMYVILDIVPPATVSAAVESSGWFGSIESRSFIIWTVMVVVTLVAATVGTLLWVFKDKLENVNWAELGIVVAIAVVACLGMIVMEEASHIRADAGQTAQLNVPGQQDQSTTPTTNFRLWPMIGIWVVSLAAVGGLLYSKQAGWWDELKQFPELDVLMILGTLVLPWAAALIPYLMKGSANDYVSIGQAIPTFVSSFLPDKSPQAVGQVVLGFFALLPLAIISITAGLVWDWKRWVISAAIFHVLFAFFFTTIFTNIPGLATGMYYSLGYWLEQQGVRRGSQPQYYYLLIIMPTYEFLPVIGSVLAMISGLTAFWRFRRKRFEDREEALSRLIAEPPAETPEGVPNISAVSGGNMSAVEEEAPGDREQEVSSDVEGAKDSLDAFVAAGRLPIQFDFFERPPFLLFVSWWAVLNLVFYTLAGEKMPWLGTHLTLPLIFLSAWYFGGVVSKIELAKFTQRGWLYLVLFPLLLVALFQMLFPLFTGQQPFAGLQQQELQKTYSWLAYVVITGAMVFAVFWLGEKYGWRQFRVMLGTATFVVLAVLTFRFAWMASFINYDYATEFLVYAHGAPAIKTVLAQLEDISRRTTDGMALKFVYDDRVSWPYSWYFRHFTNAVFVGSNPTNQSVKDAVAIVVGDENKAKVEPLVEDRYVRFDYIRLWWPMQDYFGLTAQRVENIFDFSPDNLEAPQIRQGIWDIFWARNYDAYGKAVKKNFDVTQWPVADHMYFYVRKDVAAQIWSYGTGGGTVSSGAQTTQVNQCTANWQQRYATLLFNPGTSPLNRPLGLSVDANGQIYVAEEYNFRVSVFDNRGVFQRVIGSQGSVFENGDEQSGKYLGATALPGNFMRPNGLAIAPNGNLYVADTWNYRIQELSVDGKFITAWGQPGRFGIEAPQDPTDGFWGPRAVAIDGEGRVYVADTGNKRIRVYTATGQFVRDIGSGGSGLGEIDEPVGMALHPDGRLFVADTWNHRISVFMNDGTFINSFAVKGWYDDKGNRPYLALDPARNLLYVTDPDGGRVLVYDVSGNCAGSFGQLNTDAPDESQFSSVGGIAVDKAGFVYVADAGSGRVLKFDPFTPLSQPAIVQPEVSAEATQEAQQPVSEKTGEVQPNVQQTQELTPVG